MTELAEVVEAARKGEEENMREELADVLIRVFDYCAALNMDLDKVVSDKMEKNRTRPYRHGNKLY